MGSGWRPTAALGGAVAVIAGCLLLAVFQRRPDLVVVATPLVVGLLVALLRSPPAIEDAGVELHVQSGTAWEDDLAAAAVDIRADAGVDIARLAIVHGPGVRIEGAGALSCVRPAASGTTRVPLRLRAVHWGRSPVGPVTVTLTAAHGLLRRDLVSRTALLTTVPLRAVFDATDIVPQAAGLVGGHRSRRPGGGTDLLAVRPFIPGDRLRRITWPVSLRTGQLHVTTTTDDRDTDVQLVIDSAVDAGDSSGSSLDVTVRSAASIAEHYLRQGDRVGLIDLGAALRPVRLAAGRRHMRLVLDVLLGAGVRRPDHDRSAVLLRAVPPRALVMVFSTLLDDTVRRHLAALARGGRTLLVIDTLPPTAGSPPGGEWTPLAWRIALVSRDTLRQGLAELGVPVVPWRGARSLDDVLVGLSRAASAPRRRR